MDLLYRPSYDIHTCIDETQSLRDYVKRKNRHVINDPVPIDNVPYK